jgi:HopJ type III effector protein
LFAEHYQAVLKTPDGTDHQNIRQFMLHGWEGIVFEGHALIAK